VQWQRSSSSVIARVAPSGTSRKKAALFTALESKHSSAAFSISVGFKAVNVSEFVSESVVDFLRVHVFSFFRFVSQR
jgi:hypothetical protein